MLTLSFLCGVLLGIVATLIGILILAVAASKSSKPGGENK